MKSFIFKNLINIFLVSLGCSCSHVDKTNEVLDLCLICQVGDSLFYQDGKYNAFTDLCLYNNKLYLCFRNSNGYIPNSERDYGQIFIYESEDGELWKRIYVIHDDEYDLRDPKLVVDNENRLILYCGYSVLLDDMLVFQGTKAGILDLREEKVVLENIYKDFWLWRVTWHDNNSAYSLAYNIHENVCLLKSYDGFNWFSISSVQLDNCNEADLYFSDDNIMNACIRTNFGQTLMGVAAPPYTCWEFDTISDIIHCPRLLCVGDLNIYLAGRTYRVGERGETVSLFQMNKSTIIDTIWTSSFALDCGYPGLVKFNNNVFLSYYLSDGISANIYLQKFLIRTVD